jgi:hypothetical protein
MSRYPTHSWHDVVDQFRKYSPAPLADAVAQIAASRYAGLHPVASMHTLLLYQHDPAGHPEDERLVLDYESGEFVLRYQPGRVPDHAAALRVEQPTWTKRGKDSMALLDRAIHHLRWFVEYREPAV